MAAQPLTSALAAALERALNAALVRDQQALARCAEHAGQTLLLDLSAPPAQLRVLYRNDGVTVLAADPALTMPRPQTVVSGSAGDLLQALVQSDLPPGVRIDGDAELLSTLRRCAADLNPAFALGDQLDALATNPGFRDLLGHAELALAALRSTAEDAFSSLQDVGRERFVDEAASAGFARRLEDLQLRVDRLNARVDRL